MHIVCAHRKHRENVTSVARAAIFGSEEVMRELMTQMAILRVVTTVFEKKGKLITKVALF